MEINITCWSCGKRKTIDVERLPQFGFEVAYLANKLGMKGVIDLNRSRTLVFCDDDCYKKQLKKDGTLRLRPLK